ncbi:MAG: hypothetical protein OEL87_03590 [Nanoarchaeota archaeon]|nr:hypothetical protein [Nanoarchaeota archaeon]
MVSGAVIIGRPIGPNMVRPFSKLDFLDLREKCGLSLILENPVEVAHLYSLDEPDKYAYQEGILVNVYGGSKQNREEFVADVGNSLVYAAQMAEKLWSEYLQRGEFKPWQSDLDYQKVCCVSMREQGDKTSKASRSDGLIWTPYVEVVETYPDSQSNDRYMAIASDLSARTRDARINRYNIAQARKFADDVNRVSDF